MERGANICMQHALTKSKRYQLPNKNDVEVGQQLGALEQRVRSDVWCEEFKVHKQQQQQREMWTCKAQRRLEEFKKRRSKRWV